MTTPQGQQPEQDADGARAIEARDPAALDEALKMAVDFRGDVTLTLATGETIEGYLYDRTEDAVRILPSDGGDSVTIVRAQLAALAFTGRDTAAGKSFDTWIKTYAARKEAERTEGMDDR
jgi:hypothetical protein